MKRCPLCSQTFEASQEFCPNDGERLVEVSSAGSHQGQTWDERVRLDALRHDEDWGAVYDGVWLEGEDAREARVTVFSADAWPRAERAAVWASTRALLGESPEAVLLPWLGDSLAGPNAYVAEARPGGASVAEILASRGKLHWKQATCILCSTASVLEWLDHKGVVHRNLSPASVFLTDEEAGFVQLGSLAHGVLWHRAMPTIAAQDGEFVGAAAYMAPEVIEGGSADARAMIYALGLVLYEMVVGAPAYQGARTVDVLQRHGRERPMRLTIASQDRDLPERLDELFEQMTARDPERRFQTFSALINALSSLLEQPPPSLDEMVSAFTPTSHPAAPPMTQVEEVTEPSSSFVPVDGEAPAPKKRRKKRRRPPGDEPANGAEARPKRRRKKRRPASEEAPSDASSVVIDDSFAAEVEHREENPDAVAGSTETSAEAPAPESDAPKTRKKRRRKRRRPRPESADAVTPTPATEEAPSEEDAPAAEAPAPEAPSKEEDKPADGEGKRRRRRKRRPRPEDVEGDLSRAKRPADEDAEAPKKRRRRRPPEDADGEGKRRRRRRPDGDGKRRRRRKPREEDKAPQAEAPKKPQPLVASGAQAEELADHWFDTSHESAWERSLLEDYSAKRDLKFRAILFSILGLLGVGAIVFIVWTAMSPPEDDGTKKKRGELPSIERIDARHV